MVLLWKLNLTDKPSCGKGVIDLRIDSFRFVCSLPPPSKKIDVFVAEKNTSKWAFVPWMYITGNKEKY